MNKPQTILQEIISDLIMADYDDGNHPVVVAAIEKLKKLRDDLEYA